MLQAHEPRVPEVPAEDVARIQPPLYGSENFARILTRQWQGLVPEGDMESMQRINEALGWLEAANQGAADAPGLRETAWLRWRVSEECKALAASLANLQTVDFRKQATPESSLIEIDPQLGALALRVTLGEGIRDAHGELHRRTESPSLYRGSGRRNHPCLAETRRSPGR